MTSSIFAWEFKLTPFLLEETQRLPEGKFGCTTTDRKKHNSTENEKLISRQNSLLVCFARPKNSLVGYSELEVGRLDEKNVVEIEGKVREKVKPPGESSRLHIGTSLFMGLIWSREKKHEEPGDPKPRTKMVVTEVSPLQPPCSPPSF
ncbi:hypothetical protein RUM44_003498 [Polyplax serrata]|uniref:Uncharacterized protein n=1 Tax=Polyplax serrata TaxID=468196 RepID=A0ABR1AGM2_POLSC